MKLVNSGNNDLLYVAISKNVDINMKSISSSRICININSNTNALLFTVYSTSTTINGSPDSHLPTANCQEPMTTGRKNLIANDLSLSLSTRTHHIHDLAVM